MEEKKRVKIALVQCPMFNVRMPLLGPAYLKSNLERNDYLVKQFDFNIALYNNVGQDYKKYWNYEFEPQWVRNNIDSKPEDIQIIQSIPFLSEQLLTNWAEDIIKSDAELIGFTVYYTSVSLSVLLAKKIKELDKNLKIIFGGPFVLSFLDVSGAKITNIHTPIHNILNIIDILALGEGEETILDVVDRLENNESVRGCESIITKENDSLIVNNLRPLIRNLNSLPFPDFSILNSHTYTDKNFLPILASRGCPNRCTFCDHPYLDRYKLRIRQARNVVDEIKCQIRIYGTTFFHFNDSMINADYGFLMELCDLIIEENIPIRWGASASIRESMNRYKFNKMKKAGCEYISFGIESASNKVLQNMRKLFTAEIAKKNLVDCYESGISVCTNWIIGYHAEEETDFEETLNFVTENSAYINEMDASLFSIKPHTYVYENYKKLGIYLDKDFMWHTKNNKNNYELRLKRLEKFRQLQKNLGARLNDRVGGLRE